MTRGERNRKLVEDGCIVAAREERLLDIWCRKLQEELLQIDAPILAALKGSLDPDRAALLLIGRTRASTLKRYLSYYRQWRLWLAEAKLRYPPGRPTDLVDYLLARRDEPCGRSVPEAILKAISWVEKVAEFPQEQHATHGRLAWAAKDKITEIFSERARLIKRAPRYPVYLLARLEELVLDPGHATLSVSGSGRASSRTSSRSGGMSGQEELVPDDMSLDEFKKRTLEHAELEAEESAAKKVREGESSEPVSPSRGLYPPLFAGRVSQEDDILHWDEHEDLTAIEGEDVEYEDLVEEEMEDEPKNDQGESPPEVSPEKLDSMDQEAAVEELNRLSKIGVIEEFAESGASGSEKRMDLREVYDWRYRDGKWGRRCRIVAREYRAGAASTADTFSPTASNAAARLVLLLHLLNPTWVILVLDIKDAYLQVPQQEEVLVTISDWMKRAANIGEGIVWRLKRCLPGQRNAGTRWYEH